MIADTSLKRMIGLMYRKSIKSNQCMLFIFENEGKHAIWMQNMEFAIDVLWLDRNYKIVDIKENFMPCKSLWNCKEYVPKKEAKYVIELNKGTVKKEKITFSSKVKIN